MIRFSQTFDDDEWEAEDDDHPGIVGRGPTELRALDALHEALRSQEPTVSEVDEA